MKVKALLIFFSLLIIETYSQVWQADNLDEWSSISNSFNNTEIRKANDMGGIIDLMGNGALMLKKTAPDSLYMLSEEFYSSGEWTSEWKSFDSEVSMKSLSTDIIIYGKKINMDKGWVKFSGNPIFAGSNTLLPLNEDNITEQTILLPDPPGGVPQDQSIIKGKGEFEGKWILLFNHTPTAWPNDYYWSMAFADSLSPLKDGVNPFYIPDEYYPLFGPIDNQAPNDWIDVNGKYYAPDETYQSSSHLWVSDDLITWNDLGVIENKTGTDPGLTYDGIKFHLFSENGNTISHCFLDIDSVKGYDNKDVLDVGDHTGDADVGYFNNQWHMFVDDGEHLFYKISYAATSPNNFPYGWELVREIYGPHKPEQGQQWDDDNEEGNRFGTGDADFAVEGNTIYLFTERPIGVAYKELDELLESAGHNIEVQVEVDNNNNDGIADETTGWLKVEAGNSILNLNKELTGKNFRIKFRFQSQHPTESPLIKSFKLSQTTSEASRIELHSDKDNLFVLSDSLVNITCRLFDDQNVQVNENLSVNISVEGPGFIQGPSTIELENGIASFVYQAENTSGISKIIASAEDLISDTVFIKLENTVWLDNFENYLYESQFSNAWKPLGGLTAETSLDTQIKSGGEYGLKFYYKIGDGSPPFSGIGNFFSLDYTDVKSINFWYFPDGTQRDLIVRLYQESKFWDYTISMASNEETNIEIPLTDFIPNSGSELITPSQLTQIAFYVLPGNGGTGEGNVYFDNIYFKPTGSILTAVKNSFSSLPIANILYQNYPNPFNSQTVIKYSINQNTFVKLAVYNVLGELIDILFSGFQVAGNYKINWNANKFPTGVYFVSLNIEKKTFTKKIVYIK